MTLGRLFKQSFLITICCLMLIGCEKTSSSTTAHPKPEKELGLLKRGIYTERFQLDPHLARVSADIAPLRDLLVGLTAFDKKGQVVPAIAREWFHSNYQEWIFVLDEKATWSNGKQVTAQDFVASWTRLISNHKHSPWGNYLVDMGIDNALAVTNGEKTAIELGVEALNDQTLKISLISPNPEIPRMVAHSALMPTYGGLAPSNAHFISNGDYQLKQITKDQLKLTARKKQNAFQQVEYHILTSIQNISRFDIIESPLESQQHNLVKLPRQCTYFYAFNFHDPLLSKKAVRQMIRSMVSSVEIGQGIGIPNQFVLPRTTRKLDESYTAPLAIETILNEQGVNLKQGIKLNISYKNKGEHPKIANRLLRSLGQSDLLQISPTVIDPKAFALAKEQGNYQLIHHTRCANSGDLAEFLYPFHSKSQKNINGYSDEWVDEQLERLRYTENPTERNHLIQRIAQYLEDEVVILSLFQPQRKLGVDPSIIGINLHNLSEVIYSKDLSRAAIPFSTYKEKE